ncbi:MAG: phosphoglucosamine mutase [Bacteroidales bacterium]|nr:phosphoglucosamine mutase [Bacteroidales bacterium]
MTLIKSISGIRGTIGGKPGDGLSPLDTVKFTAAFARFLIERGSPKKRLKLIVGRDGRISGDMVNKLVAGTLMGMGVDVIDGGLSTTPTIEMAVVFEKADGGIIITASHNPKQWNALKLLNEKGEFISAEEGGIVLKYAEEDDFVFADVEKLGTYKTDTTFIAKHIKSVLALPLVDLNAIKARNFRIAIDCVNSTGGISLPPLLKALGVKEVIELYCTPNGIFPHNPEPLPENVVEISTLIKKGGVDVGFVVDPDVDRLAIIMENGEMLGEEYTLVAVADYILQNKKGNTVSNLSSTRALRDVTVKQGMIYQAAAVGEVNVVEKMKEINAIIGGEGNGGIIYPALHYGRDALVGIALFLSYLAKSGKTCSELRATYPAYFMSKNKIQLAAGMDVDAILEAMAGKYSTEEINTIDGVKIDFADEWVHLRKSNTEPIIRVYAESGTKEKADRLAFRIMDEIKLVAGI